MQYNKKGFVGIVSVLVLSLIGGVIISSLLLRAVDQLQANLQKSDYVYASSLTEQCMEDALQQIVLSFGFTGSGSVTVDGGGCTYTVSGGSLPKTIQVDTSYKEIIKSSTFTLSETGISRVDL